MLDAGPKTIVFLYPHPEVEVLDSLVTYPGITRLILWFLIKILLKKAENDHFSWYYAQYGALNTEIFTFKGSDVANKTPSSYSNGLNTITSDTHDSVTKNDPKMTKYTKNAHSGPGWQSI